jgi:hypothetical protein
MWKTALFAGLLIAVGSAGTQAQGAKPLPTGAAENPFKGQAAALVVRPHKGDEVNGVYLGRPEVRQLGDRFFVVGEYINLDRVDPTTEGTRTWTPLSDVIQIREYDTVEAMKKAFKDGTGGDK